MKPQTVDEVAVRILLEDVSEEVRQAKLSKLAKVADRMLEGGDCPECMAKGPHMNNGEMSVSRRSYCCNACGTQWDAEET